MLIDCTDPGLENLLSMGEYKVAKTGDCSDLRPFLTVTSDERSPPNLISEVNTYAALGERIITKKFQTERRDLGFVSWRGGKDPQFASLPSSLFFPSRSKPRTG